MRINQILPRIRKKYQGYKEFQKYKEILKNNIDLVNIGTSRTCFVIGNGPSIKDLDLVLLANKDTFVMNSFWRHPQYKLIKPKYYVATSFPYLSYGKSRPRYVQDEDLPGSNSVISQVPETKLIFSMIAKETIEKNNFFPNNPKYYILQQGFMDERLNFNIDPTKPLPFTKNTFLLAILLAVNMGFENIYLLGCEHNFLDQPPRKWFYTFKHFYNDPYKIVPEEYTEHTYENGLENTLRLFRNYRFFKEKVAKLNPRVKIFNATPDSFLDVFPFIKYEDIKL